MEKASDDSLESIRTSINASFDDSDRMLVSLGFGESASFPYPSPRSRPASYAPEILRHSPAPSRSGEPLLDQWAGFADPSLCRAELLHEIFEATVDKFP